MNQQFRSTTHELFVSFDQESSRPSIAQVLCSNKKEPFIVLIVKTECQRKEITFSTGPAKRQVIVTIGAISSRGYLGAFKGLVLTPSCAAFDDLGDHLVGTEEYFLLKCTFQDNSVDAPGKLHTANKIISSPILCLSGSVVGIVASVADSNDVKVGLHNNGIYNSLRRLCGGSEWKKLLKEFADNFCKEELSSKGKRKRDSEDATEGSLRLFP